MFATSGEALQVSEVLYGKPVLVQRGRFRPPTLVNQDIQQGALAHFCESSIRTWSAIWLSPAPGDVWNLMPIQAWHSLVP